MSNFPINDFYYYLKNLKTEFSRVNDLKKSFYCDMCDITKQKFISQKTKSI